MHPAFRQAALLDLIELRRPLRTCIDNVRRLPWDSDDELAHVTRVHLLRVIRGFTDDEFTADEVEAWAEALESREDVGFEHGFEDLMRSTVVELANPALFGPLTKGSAIVYASQLRRAERVPLNARSEWFDGVTADATVVRLICRNSAECCFCGLAVSFNAGLRLAEDVMNDDDEVQAMMCHAECLRSRLRPEFPLMILDLVDVDDDVPPDSDE